MLWTSSPAAPRAATLAQGGLELPAYRELVQRAANASWTNGPSSAPGARLAVLVELELPPLALAAHGWDHEQRVAYSAQVAAAQDAAAAEVERVGGTVLARFSHASSGLAVAIDAGDAPALAQLPGVSAVLQVSDYVADQTDQPVSAASLAELAALIGSDQVLARGNDGSGIDIALVDSGIDYTHIKLGGSGDPADYRLAACGDPALTPGTPDCPAGQPALAGLFPNSKVRGGYDFVGDVWPAPDPRCDTEQICAVPDNNPIDLSGHGTHVADIVAGLPTTPGGTDGGVAPGANLWAFKACNGAEKLCDGVALLSAIDAALDLDGSDRGRCTPGVDPGCREYDPADVINLSLSFSYGQPEDPLGLFVNIASFYGSLVVAAAGNDGDKPYIVGAPAAADGALAVGESSFPPPAAPEAPVLELPVPIQAVIEKDLLPPPISSTTNDSITATVGITATLPQAIGERMAADASRGPRIADSGIKPDLAAPGAVLSALAGSGSELAPFGGSSGSAPVVAGVAALIIQELEQRGLIDPSPGLGVGDPRISLAPLVKAVLMNNAFSELQVQDGSLAPITLQGAGRVSAIDAFLGRTIAWDASEMIQLLAENPALQSCSIQPYIDLLVYLFFKVPPPCAAEYPSGNELYRAWNAQSASLSFGYQPTTGPQELSRQVVVHNYSRLPRSYSLSAGLRFAEDVGRGVELSVTPDSLTLPGGGLQVVTLTLTISPTLLPDWTLNGGELGNSGSASCVSPTPELDCPSLTLFEVDGALLIDGGTNNRISLPIHVLPRKVADASVSQILADRVLLGNQSTLKDASVEAFALTEISPNKCDTRDGLCSDVEYIVGVTPSYGQSPVDIGYVGVRSYSVPGLNAEFGLPAAPAGALADELIEFAVTVYDRPYRASPNFPAQFEVHIDGDRDGVTDYVVFNADLGAGSGDSPDGRNAVFVRDVNPADGTQPTRPYLFTAADFNTQSWVLPVPAAAVGLRSDQPFSWYVLAFDAYFREDEGAEPWDCSPGPPSACGASAHQTQTGALRFRPAELSFTVPAGGDAALLFSEDPGGAAGSPSQIGLLLLYRDALPGRGAAGVLLP